MSPRRSAADPLRSVARPLFGATLAVLLLAGCGAEVAGSPEPTGVPLTWQKSFISQRFVDISSFRVEAGRSAREVFLRRLPAGDLREQMSAALDAAPPGAVLYAGTLDTNCQPAGTPRLRVLAQGVVLDTPLKSTYDGECMVAYTSYAVVAVDPSATPTG